MSTSETPSLVAPAPEKAAETSTSITSNGLNQGESTTFLSSFSHILDPRLLRGLSNLGHTHPTPVQAAVIPVALGGSPKQSSFVKVQVESDGAFTTSGGLRDILARARTGTGKTLAYGLPIMQKILEAKKSLKPTDPGYKSTRALILVPTRELSEQVYSQLRTLAEACGGRSNTAFSNAKENPRSEADGDRLNGISGKGKGKAGDIVDGASGEAPIEILNISRDDIKPKVIRMLLGGAGSNNQPDIIVSTPSKLLQFLRRQVPGQKRVSNAASSSSSNAASGDAGLDLSFLESIVIDEADFMLAYGHDLLGAESGEGSSDGQSGGFIKEVLQAGWWTKAEAKGGVQRFLISATLNADVEKLRGLILRRPVVLDMQDSLLAGGAEGAANEAQRQQLLQYSLHLSEVDKFLLLYVILKLRLIRGKTLIFVNSIERGYRLKLFLEQFGITKAAVLNHELPFNTRMKKVEAFNKDAIAVMIATDEVRGADMQEEEDEEEEQEEDASGEESASRKRKRADANDQGASKKSKKDTSSKATAAEYSVSRGVDFLQVACVINFDMPTSLTAYTHRVGRTARAGNTGTALSFIVPKDQVGVTTGTMSAKTLKHLCCPTAKYDEGVWKKVQQAYAGGTTDKSIQEWKYDKAQIEAFRYRMEDALRSVTKLAIKEARVKELKWEMLNSEKLKSYWEDNPKDLEYLKAQTADVSGGKMLGSGKVQGHLKHVPGYLMPRIAGFKQQNSGSANGTPGGYISKRGDKGKGRRGGPGGNKGKRTAKKSDPLKKFKAK